METREPITPSRQGIPFSTEGYQLYPTTIECPCGGIVIFRRTP